jgi:hypothetical protein
MAANKQALREVPRSWAPGVEIRSGDLAQAGGGVTAFIINDDGGDLDFTVEADGNTNAFDVDAGLFTGKGALGLLTNAVTTAAVTVDPPATTAAADTDYAKVRLGNTAAVTVPTGTAAVVSSLYVEEPNITATGTVTDAATVYVEAAPTEGGTGNYAVFVDAGLTRLDGTAALGALVLGGVAPTNPQAFLAVLPPANAAGITAAQSYFHAQLLPGGAVTIPAGTAPVVASLNIHEPNITATGTVTDAATVRIVDAPTEGSANWAFWVDAGAARFDGTAYIGDTSNANVTLGLTINQGTADDVILALKSSDCAHGVTDLAETDTYGQALKMVAADGGLSLRGFSDAKGALELYGVAVTEDTTDAPTTASEATIVLRGAIKSGTGVTAHGATGNLLSVMSTTTNQFVIKGDGELYSNQSATVGTFDTYEDALMCWDLAHLLANQTQDIFKYHRDTFIQAGILTEGGMLSLTKMNQLLLCTAGQLHTQIQELRSELNSLKALPA